MDILLLISYFIVKVLKKKIYIVEVESKKINFNMYVGIYNMYWHSFQMLNTKPVVHYSTIDMYVMILNIDYLFGI